MYELIGQQWGNYRLTRLLGRGGFADVYLGSHIRINMQAALKIMHAHLSVQEADTFLSQAQTIGRLLHPNIVRLLDFDVYAERPFLVLDYAPNGSLSQRHANNEQVPLTQIVSYVKQVAIALQFAHDQGIIHRDVKPSNMLLGHDEILLSDFGIITLALPTASQEVSTIFGTASYMAPEQFQGRSVPLSDQYALAIVTYQWLSGTLPFQGSFNELLAQHLAVSPPPLTSRVVGLPSTVENVIMRALAKDAHQRFPSISDFAHALERASVVNPAPMAPDTLTSSSKSTQTIVMGAREKVTPPVSRQIEPERVKIPPSRLAMETLSPQASAMSNKPLSRRRLLIAGGAALATLGLAAVGLGAWNTRGRTKTPTAPQDPVLYSYTGFNPKEMNGLHSLPIDNLLWSSDSKRLGFAAHNGNAKTLIAHIWDANDGKNHSQITIKTSEDVAPTALIWTQVGPRLILIPEADLVSIYDAITGKQVTTYNGHRKRREEVMSEALAWSPDGRFVASRGDPASMTSNTTFPIWIWDASSGKEVMALLDHTNPTFRPFKLCWSPDSRHIAAWGVDQPFAIWDVASGALISHYSKHIEEWLKIPGQHVSFAAALDTIWSPNGNHILCYGQFTGTRDMRVHVWNPDNGQQESTYTFNNATGQIFLDAGWSSDNTTMAMGNSKVISVWNALTGQPIYTYSTYSEFLRYTWAPDGKHIASTIDMEQPAPILLWDASSGQVQTRFSSHKLTSSVTSMLYSPDGTRMALLENKSGIIDTFKLP